MTGRKDEQLLFRKHSMYPGGLKETPYKTMIGRNPDEVRDKQGGSSSTLPFLGHSTRSLRHVTEEQAERPSP